MENTKILKSQLLGVSPNSKLMREYKNSLHNLSKEQWEASIGLMLGVKYYSTIKNSETTKVNKRLTKLERSKFVLSEELKSILVGLLLGDLCAQKRSVKGNVNLHFEQGIVHKDYIYHLYNKFSSYCHSEPKTTDRLPDKRTSKVYTRIQFVTYSLPCFNELYDMFYLNGKKRIPSNIGELLTPLGLAYWICDDGLYDRKNKRVTLSTESYTLEEVNLLKNVLKDKFNLTCFVNKHGNGYIIAIATESISSLQKLLSPIMPSMFEYKIGL